MRTSDAVVRRALIDEDAAVITAPRTGLAHLVRKIDDAKSLCGSTMPAVIRVVTWDQLMAQYEDESPAWCYHCIGTQMRKQER